MSYSTARRAAKGRSAGKARLAAVAAPIQNSPMPRAIRPSPEWVQAKPAARVSTASGARVSIPIHSPIPPATPPQTAVQGLAVPAAIRRTLPMTSAKIAAIGPWWSAVLGAKTDNRSAGGAASSMAASGRMRAERTGRTAQEKAATVPQTASRAAKGAAARSAWRSGRKGRKGDAASRISRSTGRVQWEDSPMGGFTRCMTPSYQSRSWINWTTRFRRT
ncbi:MAG: hypothetical protein H7841_11205 [Magnetospirillum sp. WYHS-4]